MERPFWAALKRKPDAGFRLLLILSGGLGILAGLLTLISPAPVVPLLLRVPVGWITAVLTRPFGAGVFSLGLACLKARDDVQSPAGLAVSIGITSYNVLAAVVIIWTATGSGLGGLLLWGAGGCPCSFLRDILVRPRGDAFRLNFVRQYDIVDLRNW